MTTRVLQGQLKTLTKALLRPKEEARPDVALEEERARGAAVFYEFVKMAWHVVEPGRTFVDGWHIRVICDHLQAITDGRIRNLIINIPPRHMKSLLVCVLWPAWEWINHPEHAFLTSSYADRLSVRDAVKARRLIQSVWYRERWGKSFRLASDQNAKTRYDNDQGGYRIATSVEGLGTGEGGDRIVVDDPHNVLEATSDAVRESVITWWDETMSTRGNDPRTVAKVVVMQRVHAQDLTGHLLEKKDEHYDHLCLRAEFEPPTAKNPMRPTSIGFRDPRTKPGELLWQQRFGRDEVTKLKAALGGYGAAAQLQQRPVPIGGGIIKIEWFPRYATLPSQGLTVVSLDCANKAKELNSYSVAGAFREFDNNAYVADVWRDRVEYPDLKRNVKSFCERWRPHVVLIEDKGNGTALIQDLRRETTLPIIAIEPEGDKIMRASRTSPTVEARRVMLPVIAPWLPDFESEVGSFPLVSFMDQVDMLTQYLDRFGRGEAPGFASSGSRQMQGIRR